MKRNELERRLQQINQRKQIALAVILVSLIFACGGIGVAFATAGKAISLQASLYLAATMFIVVLYAQITRRDLIIEERWLRLHHSPRLLTRRLS